MMPKLRTTIIIFLITIFIGGLFLVNNYLSANNLLFYSTGTSEKAFLDSTWEMSPREIERANNTVLKPPRFDFRGISYADDPYPRVINMKRYKSLVQNGLDLWSHSANVNYGFFDDKLFTYVVEISVYRDQVNQLNKIIISKISEKYGQFQKQENKTYYIQGTWNKTPVKVYYWIYESENKFSAHIRFDYTPIIEHIGIISKSEQDRLF